MSKFDNIKKQTFMAVTLGQANAFLMFFVLKPFDAFFYGRWKYYIPSALTIPFLSCAMGVFVAYAFCNVNDVSWGNRPKITGDTSKEGLERAKKAIETKAAYN